jgi:hypothetical protein
MAINREAPRPLTKFRRLCKPLAPRFGPKGHWAIIAYGMVSIWLTKIKGRGESSKWKKSASTNEADFDQIPQAFELRLLAILLDAGGPQAR